MDASSKKRRSSKSGKAWQVIRNFFLFLAFVFLIGFSGFNYWQLLLVRQQNAELAAANASLLRQLAQSKGKRSMPLHVARGPVFDPTQDAKVHLSKAETAIAKGNIGDALAECKVAAVDIQLASSSTSSAVRTSVGDLQQKLDSIRSQSANLFQKLGV